MYKKFILCTVIYFYNFFAIATNIDLEQPMQITSAYSATARHVDISTLSDEELASNLQLFKEYSKRASKRYLYLQRADTIGSLTMSIGLLTAGISNITGIMDGWGFYGVILAAAGSLPSIPATAISSLLPSKIALRPKIARDEGVVAFSQRHRLELQAELKERGYLQRIVDRIIWSGRSDQGLNLLGIYED